MAIDVDVSSAMNTTKLTVTIRPTRVWLLRLRVLVGSWFIFAGARIMGSSIDFVLADPPGIDAKALRDRVADMKCEYCSTASFRIEECDQELTAIICMSCGDSRQISTFPRD